MPIKRVTRSVFAFLAVSAVLVCVLLIARPALFGTGKQSISSDSLGATFRDIAELSTEEYVYSQVGSFAQEGFQVAGRTIPFTGRNFLVTYDGTVKAGIRDAERIKVKIDEAARTITIDTPHAEVLSSTISPESITVYDQSMNPLNQIRVQDISDFLAKQELDAENNALERGLLQRADNRTMDLLRNHAEALTETPALAEYTVNVRWA